MKELSTPESPIVRDVIACFFFFRVAFIECSLEEALIKGKLIGEKVVAYVQK